MFDLSTDFEFYTESPVTKEYDLDLVEGNDSKVLRDFIEMYEIFPELWNPTNPNYIIKTKRNAALDKFLIIYKKMKPGADRADVKRKLNTLRSNYRKELKKKVTSKRSGTGRDAVYEPTSWVFYALQFLNRFEQPVNANIQQLEESTKNNNLQNEARIKQHPLPVSRAASRSSIDLASLPQSNKRSSVHSTKQNELLQKACDFLQNSNKEQNIPTIAIAWGETLTELDAQQRIFAEKGINEILFEARQRTLNRFSVKINEDSCAVSPPIGLTDTSSTSYQSFTFENTSNLEPHSEEQRETGAISEFFTNFNPKWAKA